MMVTDYAGHYSEDGPVAPTRRFLQAVYDDDYAAMWPEMDSNLQAVRAQAWLWNNRAGLAFEHETLLPGFLASPPTHPELWGEFAQIELRSFRSAWDGWIQLFADGRLGAGSRTRVLSPNLELVMWSETDPNEPIVFDEPTMVAALLFVVALEDDRWRLASAGSRNVPEAGWPPVIS